MNKFTSAKLLLVIMSMLMLMSVVSAQSTEYIIPFTGVNVSLDDTVYDSEGLYGIRINNEYNKSIYIDIINETSRARLAFCAFSCTVQIDYADSSYLVDIVDPDTDQSLLRAPLFRPLTPTLPIIGENITENISVEIEEITNSTFNASYENNSIIVDYTGDLTLPIIHMYSIYESIYLPIENAIILPRDYFSNKTSSLIIDLLDTTELVDSITLILPEKEDVDIINITTQQETYIVNTPSLLAIDLTKLVEESTRQTFIERILSSITSLFVESETEYVLDTITLYDESGSQLDISYIEENASINLTLPNETLPGFYTLQIRSTNGESILNNVITVAVNAIELKPGKVVIIDREYESSQLFTFTNANATNFTAKEIIRNETFLEVIPYNGSLKLLEVRTENISELIDDTLRFDVNLTNITPPQGVTWNHVYAIDPEATNVTTITFTATAQGNAVYKCATWNFTTSTCPNDDWVFLQGVVPGQNYTITIDPKDPAFGEASTYLKMEWGEVTSLDDNWQTINLEHSYQRPVIVATPRYTTAGEETVTRITNISQTSFDIRLQDATGGTSTTRDVAYIVIEEGAWQLPDGTNIEAFTYHSTTTDNDADWSPDLQTYQQTYNNPIVLGQVMSYNDTSWSVFWASDGTQAGEPTSANIYTAKQVAEDPDTTRNNEEIGVIVIESGHGVLNGVEFEVNLSTDSVQGITNSPPYSVAFDQSFSSVPQLAVLSSAGMDGGNGGWPVAYGAYTTNAIGAAIDEYNDGERSHTATTIAYFVFNESGSYNANSPPFFVEPIFNETIVEPTTDVLFSVNVTDNNDNLSVTYVNATFRYPNGSEFNISLSQVAIGNTSESGDIESTIQSVIASPYLPIGETGIIPEVSSWQTVSMQNTYVDPVVFVFSRNQSDISLDEEQSIAIVRNVGTSSFDVGFIYPDDTFSFKDDVGYLVMEKGTWEIEGVTVQVGNWSYSGTSFVTRNFAEAFSATPTVYIQLQDQTTDKWYTGRYTESTLGASSIQIQYEDAFNAFSGTNQVGYIAFEQTNSTSIFEGNFENAIADDSGSGTFRTVNFAGTYTNPVLFGIVSEGGGDPTTLGIGSLTSSSVDIRPTEENVSDPELGHATNDVLWMVFNSSVDLINDTTSSDIEATKASVTYENIFSEEFNFISSIQVITHIDNYSNTGSLQNTNNNPSLQIELFDGTSWNSIGTIAGTGNKSRTTFSQSITESWAENAANRDIRITPIYVDYFNDTTYDEINWSQVYVNVEAGNRTVTWRYLFTNTNAIGQYNLTRLNASDGIVSNETYYSSISFNVSDRTPPTIVVLFNITLGQDQPLLANYLASDYSGIDTWFVNDTGNFTINSNGTLTNATNLSVGIYLVNVSVNDTYNNIASGTVRVNVTNVPDTVPPLFDHPITNITVIFGKEFIYDINASDDRGIIDAYAINDTNNFAIDGFGFLTNNTVVALGTYNITITINDTANNLNSSNLTVFVIDAVPPIFAQANNNSFEFGENVTYDVNVTDDVAIDAFTVNDTRFSITSTGLLENTTALTRGSYIINITVNDTSGNENVTTLNISIIDTTPPSTVNNLLNTTNYYDWIIWNWSNPSDIDFSHNMVYLDNVFYTNTSDNGINISGLQTETNYTIIVQTVDNDNNINTTNRTNTSQTLINNIPIISVTSPLNVSGSLEQYRVLNFSVTDSEQPTLCVTVYANNSEPVSTENILLRNCSYSVGTDITFNWSAPVLTDTPTSEVLWHFDNNSIYGETDTTVNDFATGTTEHDITCTANCPTFTEEGYFGGAFDYDGINNEWDLTEQFFNDAFSERSFQLWFKADTTSGTRYIYEEGGNTNGLGIRIVDGVIEYAVRTSSTQFNVNTAFTDTTDWHLLAFQYYNGTMELYLDGVLVGSNDTSASYTTISAHSDEGQLGGSTGGDAFGGATGNFDGLIDEVRITTTAFNTTEMADMYSLVFNETYYWNIDASDTYDTTFETYEFTVEPPVYDFSIINITFSEEPSVQNYNTTIFATINSSSNVQVKDLFINFTDINTSQHLGNRTISIDPGEYVTVNISYLFDVGNHSIKVEVDGNNTYGEVNELDNDLSKDLFVSSWSTYYGDAFIDIVAGDNDGNELYTWIATSPANILYTDGDITPNFASLYPIGRTTSGTVATNDFDDVDTVLNLTDLYDATRLRFATDGSLPKQVRSFTIAGQLIENVSFINSTNSSNFLTGILWDSTTDTNNEFDLTENETLVFVTEINRDTIGKYGVYDYEIVVPTALQDSANSTSSFGIYVDLN